MIKILLRLICILYLAGFSAVGLAKIGVSAGIGAGTHKVHAHRLNLQRDWGRQCTTPNGCKVNGYWELAFSELSAAKNSTYVTNRFAQSTSLSGTARIIKNIGVAIYFDIGIGVAYMSKRVIAGRDLGAHLLFEERLGTGFLFDKDKRLELGYRFVHYSNGYLARVNQSLNLHLLVLGYWFN